MTSAPHRGALALITISILVTSALSAIGALLVRQVFDKMLFDPGGPDLSALYLLLARRSHSLAANSPHVGHSRERYDTFAKAPRGRWGCGVPLRLTPRPEQETRRGRLPGPGRGSPRLPAGGVDRAVRGGGAGRGGGREAVHPGGRRGCGRGRRGRGVGGWGGGSRGNKEEHDGRSRGSSAQAGEPGARPVVSRGGQHRVGRGARGEGGGEVSARRVGCCRTHYR